MSHTSRFPLKSHLDFRDWPVHDAKCFHACMEPALKTVLIRILLVSAVVTSAVLFFMGWSTYSDTMRIDPRCDSSPPNMVTPSRPDEIRIAGRYTQMEDSKGAVILVHGLDTCKDDPRLIATEVAYQELGYATFAIDMRSHGNSEDDGKLHGFGTTRANEGSSPAGGEIVS